MANNPCTLIRPPTDPHHNRHQIKILTQPKQKKLHKLQQSKLDTIYRRNRTYILTNCASPKKVRSANKTLTNIILNAYKHNIPKGKIKAHHLLLPKIS